jgi:membrane associated rhomboid family serine protease
MLWLWMFGYIFHDLTGNKKIIPLFIYGALGGAIAFMLAYNFIPVLSSINATATGRISRHYGNCSGNNNAGDRVIAFFQCLMAVSRFGYLRLFILSSTWHLFL